MRARVQVALGVYAVGKTELLRQLVQAFATEPFLSVSEVDRLQTRRDGAHDVNVVTGEVGSRQHRVSRTMTFRCKLGRTTFQILSDVTARWIRQLFNPLLLICLPEKSKLLAPVHLA